MSVYRRRSSRRVRVDIVIILLLHTIISIATYMGPNTPKVEPAPPAQTVVDAENEHAMKKNEDQVE
jgi:hypothetical protein